MPLLSSNSNSTEVVISTKADNKGIDDVKSGLKSLGVDADAMGGAFATATKIAATGVVALGAAVGAAGVAAIKSAADFEQNRIAFEVMLGSASKAQDLMTQMAEFAKTTPFDLPQVEQGAKQLLAYGIQQKDLIPTMTRLGDLASGLGVPFNQIALAYGQVAVKGKLMGSETLQFMNAGIPITQTLAKVLGKTTEEIGKMQEAGDISFGDVQKAIASLTDQGSQFGGMMSKQSQTFTGVVSNLQDGFGAILRSAVGMDNAGNIIKNGLFDRVKEAAFALMPVVQQVADGIGPAMSQIMSKFDDLVAKVKPIAKQVADFLLPGFKNLASAITGSLFPAIKKITESDFARFVGTTIVVAIRAASDAIAAIIRFVSDFATQISTMTPLLVGLTAGIVAYRTVVLISTAATVAMTAAQWALNAAMTANPIGLLIGGVALLAGAVFGATLQTQNNKTATDNLATANQNLKNALDNAKTATDNLKDAQYNQEGASLRVETAQRNYNEAVKNFGPDSLEARQALHDLHGAQDDLAAATENTKNKTNDLKNAQDDLQKKKDAVVKANDEVAQSGKRIGDAFGAAATNVSKVNQQLSQGKVSQSLDTMLGTNLAPGKRAGGGPVSAGSPYIVGDNPDGSLNSTSELFIPKQSGSIMNAKDLQSALAGAGGSTSSTVIHNVNLYTAEAANAFFKKLDQDNLNISKGLTPNRGNI